MEPIKITFLGTGSSIPTPRRSHPSIFLKYKTENFLIDCGEGTQVQLRKAGINPMKINYILITHWHGDHILGLPGLLQTLNLNEREHEFELTIFGPKGSKKKFRELIAPHLRFYWDVSKSNGNKFKITVKEITKGIFFKKDDFYIKASQMDHDTPTLAYSFYFNEKIHLDKEKLKKLNLPNSPLLKELAKGKTITINNKKINGKNLIYKEPPRKITIILDTKLNKNILPLAKDSDLLIMESTFSASEKELAEKYKHLTSTQAASIAKKARAKKLILTHISQRYSSHPKEILAEAKKIFENTLLPEDLDSISL